MTSPTLAVDQTSFDGPQGPRRLLDNVSGSGPVALAEHRRTFARPDRPRRVRHDLIDAVKRAGLRGRGGAGFPTGVKLAAVSNGRGRPVVVVNATEGEPASRKDATLLRLQPHLVLDGAAWAAAAVGASEVYVCVDRTRKTSIATLEQALWERPDDVPMTILGTPPRYVAGEETALVHWINGGEAKPTATPPRPFERGVGGRPTLIDNAETLAHLALVMRYGPDWFRTMGTPSEPGTALMTVSGAVANPSVFEVPIGLPLRSLLGEAGAPPDINAVLVGGYFGSWLTPDQAGQVRMCDEDLRPAGGGLGCGAVVVLPAESCGVVESARILQWMASETAGQCGPCVNGLHAIATTLAEVARGTTGLDALARLERWAGMVEGRGACKFPDGAVRFLRSALVAFADDLHHHAQGRPCRAAGQPARLPLPDVEGGWR